MKYSTRGCISERERETGWDREMTDCKRVGVSSSLKPRAEAKVGGGGRNTEPVGGGSPTW